MKHLQIRIDGMHCDGCVKNLTGLLSAMPGVISVEISLADALGKLTVDPALTVEKDLISAIEDAGFDAFPA